MSLSKRNDYQAHANDAFLRRISANPYKFGQDRSAPPRDSEAGAEEAIRQSGNSCRMPSLAMVYAPVQTWRGVLSPQEGLEAGSIFTELIKPFMGRSVIRK